MELDWLFFRSVNSVTPLDVLFIYTSMQVESQRAFVFVKNGQGSKYIIQAFSNLYDLHDREGSQVSRPIRALIVLVCARTLA